MPQSSVMILHNSFCEHFSSSGISGEFCLAGDEGKTAWIGAKPQLIPKCALPTTIPSAMEAAGGLTKTLPVLLRKTASSNRQSAANFNTKIRPTVDKHQDGSSRVLSHFLRCLSQTTTYQLNGIISIEIPKYLVSTPQLHQAATAANGGSVFLATVDESFILDELGIFRAVSLADSRGCDKISIFQQPRIPCTWRTSYLGSNERDKDEDGKSFED
ncbi:hypothetical protein B0H14DRAFT_2568103 [Mycena olivaceomarginata]|nr:hypothetical protein B0H14DRAFT_2568103 [Mycena olivaceomarginata]